MFPSVDRHYFKAYKSHFVNDVEWSFFEKSRVMVDPSVPHSDVNATKE
jgi:hypothetical protein